MTEDLKAFCIIFIATFWVLLFSANSKSIQNWKQKLFTCIHHSLASLSVLSKHKSLSFANLSLFFHHVSISKLWLGCLHILHIHVIWYKTGIYIRDFSEKSIADVWRFIANSTFLQFGVYQPLFYPKQHEKLLQVADPLQSLPCFLKLIPSVLGRSVNFKIPKRFLCRRPVFQTIFFFKRQLNFFLWYCSHFQKRCLLYILFIRCKLYAATDISLQFIVTMFIIILCICISLLKSSCIYLIVHSSYWAAISCSLMLGFREREPCNHNKQDFDNE